MGTIGCFFMLWSNRPCWRWGEIVGAILAVLTLTLECLCTSMSMTLHPWMAMSTGWVLEYIILGLKLMELNMHLVHMIMPQVGCLKLSRNTVQVSLFEEQFCLERQILMPWSFGVSLSSVQMSIMGTHTIWLLRIATIFQMMSAGGWLEGPSLAGSTVLHG